MLVNVIGCRVGSSKNNKKYGILYTIIPEDFEQYDETVEIFGSRTREFFVPVYCLGKIKDYVGHKCFIYFNKYEGKWVVSSINIVG